MLIRILMRVSTVLRLPLHKPTFSSYRRHDYRISTVETENMRYMDSQRIYKGRNRMDSVPLRDDYCSEAFIKALATILQFMELIYQFGSAADEDSALRESNCF